MWLYLVLFVGLPSVLTLVSGLLFSFALAFYRGRIPMGVRYLSALTLSLLGVVVWGWESLLVFIIVVAGGAAIVWTLLTYFGMRPPPYVVHIFWIVVAVVLGVLAIRLIFSVA